MLNNPLDVVEEAFLRILGLQPCRPLSHVRASRSRRSQPLWRRQTIRETAFGSEHQRLAETFCSVTPCCAMLLFVRSERKNRCRCKVSACGGARKSQCRTRMYFLGLWGKGFSCAGSHFLQCLRLLIRFLRPCPSLFECSSGAPGMVVVTPSRLFGLCTLTDAFCVQANPRLMCVLLHGALLESTRALFVVGCAKRFAGLRFASV